MRAAAEPLDDSVRHDATLEVIDLRWVEGIIRIRVSYWDTGTGFAVMVRFLAPESPKPTCREPSPGGESQSINQVSFGEHDGKKVLRVEMQSGDELVIQATDFFIWKIERQMSHWKKKMDFTGENHSMKAKR